MRLEKLNLQSLELRRMYFDLINYYKILNNLSPLNPSNHFLIYVPIASSRSTIPYLQKPQHGSNKLLSSFTYRSVDVWNFLLASIRSLTTLPSFKKALKGVDLTPFLGGSAFQ